MFCPCNPYPYDDIFEGDDHERSKRCWKSLGYLALNDLVLVLLSGIMYSNFFRGERGALHWVIFAIAGLICLGLCCAFHRISVLQTSEMIGFQLLLLLIYDVGMMILISVLFMSYSGQSRYFDSVPAVYLGNKFLITVLEVLFAMCNTIDMTHDWGFAITVCLWIVIVLANIGGVYGASGDSAYRMPTWMYGLMAVFGLFMVLWSLAQLCTVHYVMAQESWWWTDYGMEKACVILAIRTTVMVWPVGIAKSLEELGLSTMVQST